MRNIKPIFTIILILTFANIYANKDRIEKPESFKFVFENNEVVNLNSGDSKLKTVCDEIVSQKRKLIEAQLTYKTGEIMTAKYDGKNWSSIKISYNGEEISVPKKKLKKITEIHFSTLNLIWSSDNEVAFNSSYFFLDFEIGTVKYYNKLPSLSIIFEEKKFSNCVIEKQVEENVTKSYDF
ncbi:hypothetical protein [Flavobacterium soli]|uniref:hypothetical protein n=1 Tax=Flavobacterium soli TaxID=344881 RepID=UPI0003FBEBD9|nr:hypothetical protein [Flavobacterium soli]